MRICIPTETDTGKNAKVYGHFGSAPFFVIYDTDENSFEISDNPNKEHIHGTCQPMEALPRKDVDIVVCGGMGARAVKALNIEGIRVYMATGRTVEEIIAQYDGNSFEEITVIQKHSRFSRRMIRTSNRFLESGKGMSW